MEGQLASYPGGSFLGNIVNELMDRGHDRMCIMRSIGDVLVRLSWNSHSPCLLYSQSKSSWFSGQIIEERRHSAMNQKYLLTKYADATYEAHKNVARFSQDIRPVSCHLDDHYRFDARIVGHIVRRIQEAQLTHRDVRVKLLQPLMYDFRQRSMRGERSNVFAASLFEYLINDNVHRRPHIAIEMLRSLRDILDRRPAELSAESSYCLDFLLLIGYRIDTATWTLTDGHEQLPRGLIDNVRVLLDLHLGTQCELALMRRRLEQVDLRDQGNAKKKRVCVSVRSGETTTSTTRMVVSRNVEPLPLLHESKEMC